jgi:CRISPR-associated protein Cmr2
MNVYHRKLYALLQNSCQADQIERLQCWQGTDLNELKQWWDDAGNLAKTIADSSDRVNFPEITTSPKNKSIHPISAQERKISGSKFAIELNNPNICDEQDIEKVFWWFWRFLPEIRAEQGGDALLFPAHSVLPDCPLHSYENTISAITGALYPDNSEKDQEHPYLLLFTFSPVQDFIKAARKFLDFWAGSYLLHYLGAKVCWKIAEEYGPDAVITPSLWSQEIIDALIVQKFDKDNSSFFKDGSDPVSKFKVKQSTSLSTAGFPNVITAIVPGEAAAKELGEKLNNCLKEEWRQIANNIRTDIKTKFIEYLDRERSTKIQEIIKNNFQEFDREACEKDVKNWQQPGCWEWNKIWDAQIEKTWESYWTAVPLGSPDRELKIKNSADNYQKWKENQQAIAPTRFQSAFPTEAEEQVYQEFNVGTWWGALQARLGQSIQAIKNTRTWSIATAPGERSSLSGQYSALHPQFHYDKHFKNGYGLATSSMRLFWLLMAEVYPGLFNGSEKLNAIELTKRMAWKEGKVAESLGIKISEDDYENLIRFPNLCSIASARFAKDNPQKIKEYWDKLNTLVNGKFTNGLSKKFYSATCRPFQIKNTDRAIDREIKNSGLGYNGIMFSSKWLADDMGCSPEEAQVLRGLVDQAHKETGFGDGSPSDWWAIVLGDGDGMGKYVSGSKLKNYSDYIDQSAVDSSGIDPDIWQNFLETKKRMGPATHVGLNRALLDFSNRLVPYITEQRFCGKVVYSGGDDVMAVLPLADLPEYLLSIRSAWCGADDPKGEFTSKEGESTSKDGYWDPHQDLEGLKKRPYFTMGEGATMSMGIVIAYKSVPLPTVLESLWTAEKEKAKKLLGAKELEDQNKKAIPAKDGLCFRVLYGSGNTLEALMKGDLLKPWWDFISSCTKNEQLDLSPLLYRLAEELPRHTALTQSDLLLEKATKVICDRRQQNLTEEMKNSLTNCLNQWEEWAYRCQKTTGKEELGTSLDDLAKLLRFSAFWIDKMKQQQQWS